MSRPLPQPASSHATPFPPSIVDRFMAWVDRLPGPVWLFHLVLLVVLIVIFNGVTWLDGSTPVGTFDLYRTSVPFYPVAVLVLMNYLNRVARRALAAFRPALGVGETEFADIEYALTTLPWRSAWRGLGLSLLFSIIFALFTPYLTEAFRRSPALFVVDLGFYVMTFGLITVLIVHTLRQLRMVSLLHARATSVNLFQPAPLYAFSGLTAQTGVGILLLNYFSILTDPATFLNPALYGLTIFTSLVAAACFVLPLRGMHNRISAEKKRLQAEVNKRLEATIQEVFRRADTQNLAGIDQLNQLMASLVTTQAEIAKLPTWPWETGTLAGFISAFLLPLIVRFVSSFLM